MNEQVAVAAAALAANLTRRYSGSSNSDGGSPLPPALVFGRIVTAVSTVGTTTVSSLLALSSEAFWQAGLNGSATNISVSGITNKTTRQSGRLGMISHSISSSSSSSSTGNILIDGKFDVNGIVDGIGSSADTVGVGVESVVAGGDSGAWNAFGRVQVPLYAVILLLAIVGNFLVIMTLVQHRRMRTITNMFLLNLAISDILLGVLCMPTTLVGALLRDFIFGAAMCRVLPYLQASSISVSAWTLVAISCERYYAICHPLRSRRWQTLRHAYKLIVLIWLCSLVCMSPIAYLSQLIPTSNGHHKCREQWPANMPYERSFNIYLVVVLLALPLFLLFTTYALITCTLWQGIVVEQMQHQERQTLHAGAQPMGGMGNNGTGGCLIAASVVQRNGHTISTTASSTTSSNGGSGTCLHHGYPHHSLHQAQQHGAHYNQQHLQQQQYQQQYHHIHMYHHNERQSHHATSGSNASASASRVSISNNGRSTSAFRMLTNTQQRYQQQQHQLQIQQQQQRQQLLPAHRSAAADNAPAMFIGGRRLLATAGGGRNAASAAASAVVWHPVDCDGSSGGGVDDRRMSVASDHPRVIDTTKITFGLRRTNTEKSLQNKKRVIKMLFVVVLEFFVCWTPLYAINTLVVFDADLVYKNVGYQTISFLQLLAYSSSCCNPITYCFMNRGFRKACTNMFLRCWRLRCRFGRSAADREAARRFSLVGVGVTQSSEVT